MATTQIIDMATLKEAQDLTGSSLPVVEGGEYKKVNLGKYEQHVAEAARAATEEQNRIDAGQKVEFSGFTSVNPAEQTSISPVEKTHVFFSIPRGAFCFETDGVYSAAHDKLTDVYNVGKAPRKDKTYLYGDRLYVAGGTKGLREVHGVDIVEGEGIETESVMHQKAVTDALKKRDARIGDLEVKADAEKAERTQQTSALVEEDQKTNQRITELANSQVSGFQNSSKKLTEEKTLRETADTDLSGRINTLNQQLTNEKNRATSAEAEESRRATTAEAAEKALREQEDARIERKIDATKTDITQAQQRISTVDASLQDAKKDTKRVESEYKAADVQLKADIDSVQKKVDEIMIGTSDHMAAAWDGTSNERAVAEAGDKKIIDFNFYLIDHKDNKNEAVAGKMLKKNNILRFKDGSYAPAVVISPEMKAETDGEVYRKVSGQLTKYCGAGAFDAEQFLREYGMSEKLYNSAGKEIHVLRPWETASTDYSVMLGCDRTVYMIDNAKGKSGKVWKSISLVPHIWDGIQPIELLPTAINPSGVYCIEDGGVTKTRCMFALKEGLDKGYVHSKGHAGAGNVSTMFVGGRTYPTTNGINQMRNMEWARNNNADPTKSVPFAEGGFPYRNLFVSWLEIMYGRKDISNANFFGNGISHVYGMSYDTWMNEGGVRYKSEGDADWTYDAWGTKPSQLCYNASGKQTSWSDMLNYQCPKEQCMESQLAASWAVENHIAEGVHFMMYGGEYWWKNVPGTLGLNDGHMNAKVYKLVKGEVNAFTKEGVAKKVTVEVVLRMSLFEGVKLAGDVYQYCGGGYEVVGETLPTSTSGGYGEPVDIYLQPDQSQWHSEKSYQKENKGEYDFEKTYPCIGHDKTKGGYALTTIPFSNFPLTVGGGLTKGDCYYFYNSNYWGYNTPGMRVRIGQRFGGSADNDRCAPRIEHCTIIAGYTIVFCGGSAQVRLLQGIADA